MINIQSVMLVALGFLVAALIALLVAPAYRRRAVRLTTDAIKRSMPLTEAEIRADKDRIRAEYAIKLHEFELKLENASLDAARQSVEINRRDALISGLEGEIGKLKTNLDEHENARRVLEHTVMDRLPKVEHRLAEAKKLLFQRDREISILTQSAEKQSRALDEATQINTHQRDEIHRLNAAITTRVARNREGLGDPKFDGEVALRSEIESLRAKSRDQAQLITRLQTLLVRAGISAAGAGIKPDAADGMAPSDGELVRLKSDLADAEQALRAVQGGAAPAPAPQPSAFEAEIRALKAENRDQAAELARVKAALDIYDGAEAAERGSAKDSKVGNKARLSSLQAENEAQAATIQALRAEIAGANERLARQAAHFRDEMRRLGGGTPPASADPRRHGLDAPRAADPAVRAPEPAQRRSLTDRIGEPRPRVVAAEPAVAGDAASPADTEPALAATAAGAETAVAERPQERPQARPRLLERIAGAQKAD